MVKLLKKKSIFIKIKNRREINLMKNNENIEQIENGESHIERDIKNAKEILERMNPNQIGKTKIFVPKY